MNKLTTHSAPAIQLKGRLMTFDRPRIMGILNLTPDSFYVESRKTSMEQILLRTEEMLRQGADIIDIGAQSTRPGAQMTNEDEECSKIVPVVEQIVQNFPDAVLSIDTFRAKVASTCIHAGAHIINDVSGGQLDSEMFNTVAKLQVPYLLMHMRGTPDTMQQLTQYDDIVTDVAVELGHKLAELRLLGVKDIILDPGFGFAKTIAQNYELLLRLAELHYFNLPILGGISRKSMIYKKLSCTPQEALTGTIALNTLLLERGVQLLRVHDVKEAKELVSLLFE